MVCVTRAVLSRQNKEAAAKKKTYCVVWSTPERTWTLARPGASSFYWFTAERRQSFSHQTGHSIINSATILLMRWLFAPETAEEHAAGVAVDLVLAFLDHRSLQRVSSVSRGAASSAIRERMLQRSTIQLTAHSVHVHELLARMQTRRWLRGVELANCWITPSQQRAAMLTTLLAHVTSITVSDAKILEQDVQREAQRRHRGARDNASVVVQSEEFVRRVRRRMTSEANDIQPTDESDTTFVVHHMQPWLRLLPATLTQLDLGILKIDELDWVARFPRLERLVFTASSDRVVSTWMDPLAHVAGSLQELVISALPFVSGSSLAPLTALRKLELKGAVQLESLDFVVGMTRLEQLILTDLRRVSDLSPVLTLRSLMHLTLDTVGRRGQLTVPPLASTLPPSLDRLERLEVMFTQPKLTQLLPHCRHIKELYLCQAPVDNWQALRALASLEIIAVNVDGVNDWSPLAALPRLKRLSLDSNRGHIRGEMLGIGWPALEEVVSPPWDDYAPLGATAGTTLRMLNLIGWRDRDSSPLGALRDAPRLETLWIAFMEGAVDLSGVGELRQLKHLHLWCASMVSIEFLRPLTKLVELELTCSMRASASIVDFSPLSPLIELKTLVLRGRPEFKDAHLVTIEKLAKLTKLDLRGTSVTRRRVMEMTRKATIPSLKEITI